MSDEIIKWIAYLDENDKKREGFFEVILDNGILIKFKTTSNIITIPYSRVLKIKEKGNDTRRFTKRTKRTAKIRR